MKDYNINEQIHTDWWEWYDSVEVNRITHQSIYF